MKLLLSALESAKLEAVRRQGWVRGTTIILTIQTLRRDGAAVLTNGLPVPIQEEM